MAAYGVFAYLFAIFMEVIARTVNPPPPSRKKVVRMPFPACPFVRIGTSLNQLL
jgi:hypothetical protein